MRAREGKSPNFFIRLWSWFTAPIHDVNLSPQEQQKRIRVIEPLLLFYLLIQGTSILVLHYHKAELVLLMIGMLVNLIWSLLPLRQAAWMPFMRSCIIALTAWLLMVTTKDPHYVFNVWFFGIIAFYCLWLKIPYVKFLIVIVPLIFTSTYLFNPVNNLSTLLIGRVFFLLLIGLVLLIVRITLHRFIKERESMILQLQQARDVYAQLDERSSQLQVKIDEHKIVEEKLAEERQLLKAIIDVVPGNIFVKDRQSRFTLLNLANLKQLGLPEDFTGYIGKTDFDYYPSRAQYAYVAEQELMQAGIPSINREVEFVDDDGKSTYFLVSKMPLYHQKTDEIIGLAGISTDITSIKRTERALRDSQLQTEQFLQRLEALNEVTLALTRLKSFDELCYNAIHYAISRLDFDRMSLWFIDDKNERLLHGSYGMGNDGQIVSEHELTFEIEDEQKIIPLLEGKETLILWNNDSPLYDGQHHVIGYGENASTAIRDGEKVVGVIFVDNFIDRLSFSEDHLEILTLYGATLGSLLTRARAEEAQKQSEIQTQQFQQLLKVLNEITIELTYTTTFDDLCYQAIKLGYERLGFDRLSCWFIDDIDRTMAHGSYGVAETGEIFDERGYTLPLNENGQIESIPLNDERIILVEEVDLFDSAHQVVGQGSHARVPLYDREKIIGCLFVDNLVNHQAFTTAQIQVLPLFGSSLSALITRRRTEEALQMSEEQTRLFQQQLRLLNTITVELARIKSFDDLCYQTVQMGIKRLGFERMGCWFVDAHNPQQMSGSYRVNTKGEIVSQHGVVVQLDESYPESEILSKLERSHIWYNSPIYEPNLAQVAIGDKAVAALFDGDKVVGCLFVDNMLEGKAITESHMELLTLYGATVGALLTRARAEEALQESERLTREFQEQLKALNTVTIELARIKEFDQLAYEAVNQGIAKLGFDRMSCWFVDNDNPDMMHGSYGTNDKGEIIPEHEFTFTITEDRPGYRLVKGLQYSKVWRDSEIFGSDKNEIGKGDKAAATLFDGDTIIGTIFVDNFLSRKRINDSQLELLVIYGATLGALFNRVRTEEALRQREEQARAFQIQLKSLHEITMQLERTTSFDELCYQAIHLAITELGFDRMSIWFADPDNPDQMIGSYGVDEVGNIRDERQELAPLADNFKAMSTEGEVLTFHHRELMNHQSKIVGYGWILVGVLWDGQKSLGWLNADNYLSKKPITDNQLDLFRLYTSTLSLLFVRRDAEDALRQSEIRYRAITEASSDIVAIIDRDMKISYVSPSLKTVLELPPEHVVGRTISDVMHPDDLAEAQGIISQSIQNPQASNRLNDFRVRHANANWVHMEAIVTNLLDDLIVQGIVISCRDLTPRIEAEKDKRAAEYERQRAQVMRQFINDVSHDFRTPLSTIGTTAYLLGRTDNPEKVARRIEIINQQIERIADLIESLKKITELDQTEEIHSSMIDINHILNSIYYEFVSELTKKQQNMALDLQDSLSTVKGDIQLLGDAMRHLLKNAIQFTPDGGGIFVRTYQNDYDIVIEVADTGVGIAPEDMPYIFDRLYRGDKARNTNTGGSGLGLAIARRIIELHKGRIDVSSEVGSGTVIKIHLPA